MSDTNTCAICEADIEGYGHNGRPVVNDRVCNFCNDFEVIPARIKNMHWSKPVKREYTVVVEHVKRWSNTFSATSQAEAEAMATRHWQEFETDAEFDREGWSFGDGEFEVLEVKRRRRLTSRGIRTF